jgi:hypothetical protein
LAKEKTDSMCTGAQMLMVNKYYERILNRWRTKTATTLEECEVFAEAHRELNKDERAALIAALRFDRTGFEKRVKVGDDRRLYSERIRPLLPPKLSVLHMLSGLTDAELDAAVEAAIVHPAMTREQLSAWIIDRRGDRHHDRHGDYGAEAARRAAQRAPYAVITLPPGMSDEDEEAFTEGLAHLCESYEVSIRYPQIEAGDREARCWARRVDAHLRPQVQKKVCDSKKQAIEAGPAHIDDIDWQRRAWPHADADLEIGPAADRNRFLEVLTRIGKADEFPSMEREAYQYLADRDRQVRESAGPENKRSQLVVVSNTLPARAT